VVDDAERTIAVIDIDGVVADVRHRLHHIEGRRRDWDSFHDAADTDPVLAEGRELAASLAREHDVVWLSGRPEWLRERTEAWLARNDLPEGRLMLRSDQDHRPAKVFKLGVLRSLSRTARLAAVVDDDPDVVDAALAAGHPAVRADWVPRHRGDALHRAQDRDGVL
jgi:hypothetical protein